MQVEKNFGDSYSTRICLGSIGNFQGKIRELKVYEVAMTEQEKKGMYAKDGCKGRSCVMCQSETMKCYSECKDDEFLSSEGKCLKCDSTCASCFGPLSS